LEIRPLRAGSLGTQRLPRDLPLDGGDLCVEELDVAHVTLDRLALLDPQLERPQPLPALDAEQIADRRLPHEPADEHRVDLVLRP
jgi:hypothetical protein